MRFAAVGVLGLGGVLAAGVLSAVFLAMVAARWPPLEAADTAVLEAANSTVSGSSRAVSVLHVLTDLGGAEAAWLLLSLTVAWLLVRRLRRLAVYVAATGLGAAVLAPGIKAIIGRARPVVDIAITSAPGPSFPSGHALGSTVTYGVLLLVFLPAAPARWRRPLVLSAVALVAVVGVTRVALGVHHPSDVVAGWLLGLLWLDVTASAFRRWRATEGLRRRPLSEGLAPEDRPALVPAPAHDAVLPDGWHSVSRLLVGGVLLWGALAGVGLVLTEVLPAVGRAEVTLVEFLVSIRTPALNGVAVAVGHLGGTVGIVIAVAVAAALALAATRRWRPSLFVLLATVGETALFLAVATVVERARPPVEHLSSTLPPTSSFPSGHVAATAATYGAIALLAVTWGRGWPRQAGVVWAVLATAGVALSRLYRGVHYPTDVVASILYAAVWTGICWRVLRPGPGPPPRQDEAGGPGPGEPHAGRGS